MKSCTYLRMTERSVSEIAVQVGYTSLSSFNQHFQRVMGCTPTAWRRSGVNARPSLVPRSGWMAAEEPEGDSPGAEDGGDPGIN
jgi:AraC-like DNA-binding protein